MLVLGCFSLSGKFESQTAWYIENVISNLYWLLLGYETLLIDRYTLNDGGNLRWV